MATELALTRPDPTMDRDTLKTLMDAAQRYVQSGLLPAEVNTPQKALVVMTAGRELGVPATYALRNIHVVKGKPVCSAELMLALVRRAYGPGAIRIGKTSNTACTVQYREQGWDGISEYTFTIEDARQAGVASSNTWKNYPAAMLRARCISAVVRFAFPECIAGLYTPDEMGAEVVVTDEGHVNIVDSTSAPVEDENGWTPELRDRWAAGLAARRALGLTERSDLKSDATRAEIVKALREVGAQVTARKQACDAFEELTRRAIDLEIDVDVIDPKTLDPDALANTHAALQEMYEVTLREAGGGPSEAPDDEDAAAF